MDTASFDQLYQDVNNWGRWGPDDEQGTLNHLTPAALVQACTLVQQGCIVSLAHELDTTAGPDNSKPALHYMSRQADGETAEPRVNTDFVGVDFHGKSVTHLDALCHINFNGALYNGADPTTCVTSTGSSFGSVTAMASGLAARGVLLDLPRGRDIEWLEPGTVVLPDELSRVAGDAGVTIRRGDFVLVRTGSRARRAALGAWDPTDCSAGLFAACMRWLHEREVAVLGGDGDSDCRPSPVEAVQSPIHALALSAMGMPLIDNMNLEDLAQTCAERNIWEFLCVIAPLRVPGGTGSPVNPVAIF
jgi:kynurenine formamidase